MSISKALATKLCSARKLIAKKMQRSSLKTIFAKRMISALTKSWKSTHAAFIKNGRKTNGFNRWI